jgi:hypothetical protein
MRVSATRVPHCPSVAQQLMVQVVLALSGSAGQGVPPQLDSLCAVASHIGVVSIVMMSGIDTTPAVPADPPAAALPP